jgi:ArsR family metal-binding transcriptional regulator
MLIDGYHLEVLTPRCEPGSERFAAVAHLVNDIRDVLPYLNATLAGAVYNGSAPALIWKTCGHSVAFHPDHIGVSNVEDRDEAVLEVEELVALVNRTWENRAEIEPTLRERRRAVPMEVYLLLPRTNCKACGLETCFIYATRLTLGQVELRACPLLARPEHRDRLTRLRRLLSVEPDAANGQAGIEQTAPQDVAGGKRT